MTHEQTLTDEHAPSRHGQSQPEPMTVCQKILHNHRIVSQTDGSQLLHVDRIYMDESAYNCLFQLREKGLTVPRPADKYLMVSHLAPTFDRAAGPTDPEIKRVFALLDEFASEYGIDVLRYDDDRQGIYHVVAPERGITLPGLIVTGTDSHMTSHGGVGALGISVGYDEAVHILNTNALWQDPRSSMAIHIIGNLPAGSAPKDLALYTISQIGAHGGHGHCIEFFGPAVDALGIEGRMTLCNMMLEAGAWAAIVPPDHKTIRYFEGLPNSPKGELWNQAEAYWGTLRPDPDAHYVETVTLDAADVVPMVSWGIKPDQVIPIHEQIPEVQVDGDGDNGITEALRYMNLKSGMPIEGLKIDQVFIGSCTNGRIEDLRVASDILRGRKAVVPGLVTPGSTAVRIQAEKEGIDRVFLDAGLLWGEAGCSLCFGHHDSVVSPGNRCASTTNRSFPGRQGPGSMTHLMSPAMVAAASITGKITDVRKLRVIR